MASASTGPPWRANPKPRSHHVTEPRLLRVTREYEAALLEMAREFSAAGEDSYDLALEDGDAYFERVALFERGHDLPPDRVRMSSYWLMRGDRILGGIRLRYELIPVLRLDGGNIGYEIRPSERGKGYATRMLGLALEEAREAGMERVLLTTEPDNTASQRVMLAHGAVQQGRSISNVTGREMLHFWIELQPRS